MAIDAIEAPSSPAQNSQSSQSRHFYLAVDRQQFKMETLVDLLGLVGRRPGLPIAVCCSTRDELDSVYSTVSSLPFISSSVLYSDLAEAERALILEKFQQVTTKWNQIIHVGIKNEDEVEEDQQRSHVIVVTDACLPLLACGESPISAHLLINYELPAKKETYTRRMATCLSADGIVINMVVGGEVVILKSIEESSSIVIQEMPMQILDIL
ncbi:ATP-dependent RNA helicase eIF4A isoform X1 [Senna tora]|uniref:ATP-dependent RNA helicase eIF4A isoform X1 n=1 Tax=Senna tora TaxID=362788 RepID=A0A834TUF7_9FABA|nr:ATP-dependent RNA helicase eIF4A isoform X1 [Senna tora]